MLRILIVSLVTLCCVSKSGAQNYELGKVTVKELEEKVYPKDTTAPAAILFKKGRTSFTYDRKSGFAINHVYEFKIKIYKKEGLEWADQKVRFYIGYENLKKDRLEFSNAVTYNLENGSIVKTKLENQGAFTKIINKYWEEKIITLPNVKVGSIIEYKYVLKTENIGKMPDFEIQYNVPVGYFEYKTEIPVYYIYKPVLIGNLPIESTGKITFGRQSFEDEYNASKVIEYEVFSSVYKGKDIPALQEEPYVNNVKNYRGSIEQELEVIRFPGQPVKDYTLSWEGVANTIFKDESFGKELHEKNFLVEDVKRLVDNIESKRERLDVIFKFVQEKMNWNEVYGYFTDKGVIKAYADQVGNVAEINFILINMLKLAGLEVNPVLVSTIENGIPVYPTRTGFNYVIAAVELDGKPLLLDASRKFTSPNILPLNILNWKGRLIKENGTSQEIALEPVKVSGEYSNFVVKIDGAGKMDGRARIQRSDYNAYRFRIQNANSGQEDYLDKLEGQLGDLKIAEYKIENKKTHLADPVIENYAFVSHNQYEIIGGKIYLNPLLFYTMTKNPFKSDKRQMDICFAYPTQEKVNVNIEIPAGYVVESLPAPIKILSENKEITYMLNIVNQGNKIQIISSKEINNSIFAADQYEGLKELFQKMIASQNQKIVLKKI
jgi:hypothetical protein